MDEFFRVRVATLNRLAQLGKAAIRIIGEDPELVVKQIHQQVLALQSDFDRIYQHLLTELEAHNIFIVDERNLNAEQASFVEKFFRSAVRPVLFPIMLKDGQVVPQLNDHSIYLAVSLANSGKKSSSGYSLIEVPTQKLSRFVILPSVEERHYIMAA